MMSLIDGQVFLRTLDNLFVSPSEKICDFSSDGPYSRKLYNKEVIAVIEGH